jgi:hypothetical protein
MKKEESKKSLKTNTTDHPEQYETSNETCLINLKVREL